MYVIKSGKAVTMKGEVFEEGREVSPLQIGEELFNVLINRGTIVRVGRGKVKSRAQEKVEVRVVNDLNQKTALDKIREHAKVKLVEEVKTLDGKKDLFAGEM